MAETAEDTRVAEVVARLLARQSSLLARAADDQAAASAARLGLSWLADLMRSFDRNGAADWFAALRTRDDLPRDGNGPSAAWAVLGAPMCEELSGAVSRAGSLDPLGPDAVDWGAQVGEVGAFEEPVAHDPGPPQTPEIEPPAEPVVPERKDPEPVPPPREEPPLPKDPEIEPPVDPHAALFEAIADFSGDATPGIDSSHGRVEITGTRVLTDSGIDSASDVLLRALDRAAQAAGAVLLVELGSRALDWTVRLPRPEARHYLFVELGKVKVALPWSRVVEYGLAPGSARTRVVFGNGLERLELPVDWLFGKGEGAPASAPSGAVDPEAPAPFGLHGWVTDLEGRPVRIVDLGQPEPVQAEPIPADTVIAPDAPPVTRALVADDSMMARVFLGRLLGKRGIVVEEAEDGAKARARLAESEFELVFLDAEMPGAGALDILRDASERVRIRACVLVKDDEERRRAEAFGGLPILYKPFAEDEVRSAVDALLARAIP